MFMPGANEIDAGAEIGEPGQVVGVAAGGDRDGLRLARGRFETGVPAAVAGGHHVDHAGGDRVAQGEVEGGGCIAAEAQVDYGRGAMVGGDPVDAGDHTGVGAFAVAVEHAHGVDRDALGDAVGAAAEDARHVGAVAEAVVGCAAVDGIVAVAEAAVKFLVGGVDAGVDDIDVDAGAGGGIVIEAVDRQAALVDAVEVPGGRKLFAARVHALVLLDEGHVGVGAQALEGGGGELGSVAVEGGGIKIEDRGVERIACGQGLGTHILRRKRAAGFKDHDIAAGHGAGLGGEHERGEAPLHVHLGACQRNGVRRRVRRLGGEAQRHDKNKESEQADRDYYRD